MLHPHNTLPYFTIIYLTRQPYVEFRTRPASPEHLCHQSNQQVSVLVTLRLQLFSRLLRINEGTHFQTRMLT